MTALAFSLISKEKAAIPPNQLASNYSPLAAHAEMLAKITSLTNDMTPKLTVTTAAGKTAHAKAFTDFHKIIASGEWAPDTPALIKNEYNLAPDIVAGFDKSLAYYLHTCFFNSTLADELYTEVKGSGFKLLVAIEDRISEELHGQEEDVIWHQVIDKLVDTPFNKVPPGQLLHEYTKRIRQMRQLAKLASRLLLYSKLKNRHHTTLHQRRPQRGTTRLSPCTQELDTKDILIHNGLSREAYDARDSAQRDSTPSRLPSRSRSRESTRKRIVEPLQSAASHTALRQHLQPPQLARPTRNYATKALRGDPFLPSFDLSQAVAVH